jgi:hypothetical protein
MEIWTVLFPILLTDVVNPVLFAFMVYAAGGSRPVLLSGAMLLGHTLAYFTAGIVLALFMESIAARLANPRSIDFLIELVLGAALLWVAFGARKDTGKRPDDEAPEFTVLSAFGFGAMVNFIGIPFAVPYFAAIDQILKTDLSAAQAVLMLGDRAKPVLGRINRFLDRVSAFLLPAMLGLIGLALLADALTYYFTGSSLF